jgi:catechol 2,3-dioxygenase-like lactoylglutathione lyase family enzyme
MCRSTKAFSSFSVDDIESARRFYGGTLGIDVVEEAGMLFLQLAGEHRVLLYPKPDHLPATFTVLNFLVDEIDVAVDELVRRGVSFERYEGEYIRTDAKGVARGEPAIAWFKDPAGNILSVVEDKKPA